MFSCYIPSSATQPRQEDYDVDVPQVAEVLLVHTEPQLTRYSRPPDQLSHPSVSGFRRKKKNKKLKPCSNPNMWVNKNIFVMHYQSAVSWGFPHR